MNKIRRLFNYITGGRPMRDIGPLFMSPQAQVNEYIDGFGRKWMAYGKWSIFRVRVNREDPGNGNTKEQ